MAGLPWYGLWTEFPRHGKTLALCSRLRDDNAGMYVIRLFSYCAEHALDGVISEDVVEGAAQWKKRRGGLLEALVAVGTLEPRAGGQYYVHGWEERNGARIRKALADAAKPRGNKRQPRVGPDTVPLGTDAGSPGGDLRQETEKKQETPHFAPVRARDVGHSMDPESTPHAAGEPAHQDAQRQGVPPEAAEAHTPEARERGDESQRAGAVQVPTAPAPARRRDLRAEDYPETTRLLAELDAAGFAAAYPRDSVAAGAVERAVALVGVPAARDRVMARVEADRALRVESRPWLGWYLDAIQGQQPGAGARAAREGGRFGRDLRVGVAAPAPAEAFQGGERELR